MPCPAAVSAQGVVQLLDCKSRGALAAATRGAPVAPPRPAPEVVQHLQRARRQLRCHKMTILNVGMALRRDDLLLPARLGRIQLILEEHHAVLDSL